MLSLVILFFGFLVLLAKAPADLVKLGLTLAWFLMLVGGVISVVAAAL